MTQKVMRVGVIGAGAISDIYLKNMTSDAFPQLKVRAISANHLEHAQKKAQKYGIDACTTEELLARDDIDMVVILTPVGSHYGLIKQALEAGKHVYTEKTITDDPAKAKELLALADEEGLYLASAPDTFLGEAWQTAKGAIDDGLIGVIHSFAISGNRNNDFLTSIFAFLRQPGAGILYDYGVYYLTALVSLLGPVERVAGITSTPVSERTDIFPMSPTFGQTIETPNESEVSAILKLRSGVTGTLHIDAESAMADQAYFTIYGTKGILYLTDPNQFQGTVKYLPASGDPRNPQPPITLNKTAVSLENARGCGPADLADAIFEGRPPRASKEMAYHVLEVLTAIRDGGENGSFVDITSTCPVPAPLAQGNPGIKALAHASFNMHDAEAMMHFYKDILGMQEAFTITLGDLAASITEGEKKKYSQEASEEEKAGWEQMQKDLAENESKPWLTYLKIGTGQFIEFFYDLGHTSRIIEDRSQNYGYTKLNLEVDSIQKMHDSLTAAGITIDQDIHPTLDGATELVVHDPDGNEVQFTEYTHGRPSTDEAEAHESFANVSYLTQVAYQVKDAVNMERFYTRQLGLKKVKTITLGELADAMTQMPGADQKQAAMMKMAADQAWLDYIEAAPHEYIELFHVLDGAKNEDLDLSNAYGYQHICLEVADIHQAWEAVIANGLTPDTEISLGADGAYQFWLVDPDGNRLELMQYTKDALQLK